jgi:hypothetical protein
MLADWGKALSRVGVALGCAAVALAAAGPAHADDAVASLPVFMPYPSNWSPNYSVHPYNL